MFRTLILPALLVAACSAPLGREAREVACDPSGPSGDFCDDGDPCTHHDICGTTCAGIPYSCDDDDPCTADACDGRGGCSHQVLLSCHDVDECATNNGGCGDPTYSLCSDNFGAPPTCIDIDECATNNGGCGDATYSRCRDHSDGPPTCVDIDECATDNGGCGDAPYARCSDNTGGPPTCTDIDECATDNGGCGDAAFSRCTDNPGGPPTCTDIDECATDNGGCGDDSCWACTNRVGAPPTCQETGLCTATGKLVLFFGGARDGNLGGRAGVDALCESARPTGLSWAKGFISVSSTDELRDVVPAELQSLPVVTVYGEQLAGGWSGLFDDNLDRDLEPAVGDGNWWSGTGHSGGAVDDTCDGWTSDTNMESGSFGCGGMPDEAALCCAYGAQCQDGGGGQGMGCGQKTSVVCVGHAEQAGPIKATWCPAQAYLLTLVPPEAGERKSKTFELNWQGQLQQGSSGSGFGGATQAGACNAWNATSSLHVEIRGANCPSCPMVFSAVPAGQCAYADFSGTQTEVAEMCVYTN